MSLKSILKSAFACLLAGVAMASCSKDPAAGVRYEDPGSALVKLSIYTPSSSVPKSTRSEATADESAVERIKLVVLQKSGTEYRYRYMEDGQQIVQNTQESELTTFSALLSSSDVPLKILLVANYNDVFDTDILQEDMDEARVKELLVDSFDHRIEGELPLYGEIDLDNLKADQPNSFTVTMLRAVARVDVVNAIESDMSGKFRLESVSIYRANDQYAIVPDASAMQTPGKMTVSSASVPPTAGRYVPYGNEVATEGDASILKTYLPESLPVTADDKKLSEATCVVVGGFYGDDQVPTYYRIDFDSGEEGHPFGQVLRNHKYVFRIVQINGSGWPTPGEAAENEATAIIATMQVWDELTSEMWFFGNENYLGISSRHVILDYYRLAEKSESLQATVPFKIRLLDESGNPVGTEVTEAGGTLTAGFYTLAVSKNQSAGDDVWELLITANEDNYTGAEFTGRFQVYTDWWTFDVEVEQLHYVSDRASRYVRVLTITDLDGDLGTTDATFTAVSGQAMRMVLENKANFSPTGTVEIAGIIVYDLRNETISTQNEDDMYVLQKVLTSVDVVHLPGNCTPSVAASGLIEAWHREKKNRVLILGLDNDGTNANMEAYIYELEGVEGGSGTGTWESSAQITSLKRADDDWQGRTDRFFVEGPFGPVDEGAMGLSRTGYVGYNNGYNDETTAPILAVQTGQDVVGMMTHGINLVDGIFYCGDSGITSNRGSAMSTAAHNTGEVSTDFDRLMANIWAWIVERATMI